MSVLFFVALWGLNFGISWFNAWSVGRSWADSKVAGGWTRVVVWSAAVMSASGFTWCYLFVLAMGAQASGYLEQEYVVLMLKLGYVVIILPILGSGMAIWIDSLTTAWRRRSFADISIAGWNTYAQVHNTYSAARALPGMLGDIADAFKPRKRSSDDAKGAALVLVVLLVVLAVCGGVLTTTLIIRSTARKYAGRVFEEASAAGIIDRQAARRYSRPRPAW
jgi:hypothetical protein